MCGLFHSHLWPVWPEVWLCSSFWLAEVVSISTACRRRLGSVQRPSPGLLSHQTPAVLVQHLQQLEKERSVCVVAYWFLHWSFEWRSLLGPNFKLVSPCVGEEVETVSALFSIKWEGNATTGDKRILIISWCVHLIYTLLKDSVPNWIWKKMKSFLQSVQQDVYHQDGASPNKKGPEELPWVSTRCHGWDSSFPGAVWC